jgi:hypothetical protein
VLNIIPDRAWPIGIKGSQVTQVPFLAEPGDTGVDDARVDLAQGLVVDSKGFLGAFPQIGKKYVRLFDQAMENFSTLLVLDVQPDPFLVAVGELEGEALSIRHGKADPSHFFPAPHGISFRLLDFDHLGAQIPHNSAGPGTGMKCSEFYNTNPLQGHRLGCPVFIVHDPDLAPSPSPRPLPQTGGEGKGEGAQCYTI